MFFAHPYAHQECGTKESKHKLVRWFLPESKRLKEIPAKTINPIQQWINDYPRKILGYQTDKKSFYKN